jgi:hypothetical protein
VLLTHSANTHTPYCKPAQSKIGCRHLWLRAVSRSRKGAEAQLEIYHRKNNQLFYFQYLPCRGTLFFVSIYRVRHTHILLLQQGFRYSIGASSRFIDYALSLQKGNIAVFVVLIFGIISGR